MIYTKSTMFNIEYWIKHCDSSIVSDRGMGCCLEPKGNGVNPGGGDEGGPGPPSRDRDKQLTARRGVDSIMEQEEDGKKGQV
jgi:hypothetical protein